jgi:hypothetical protein
MSGPAGLALSVTSASATMASTTATMMPGLPSHFQAVASVWSAAAAWPAIRACIARGSGSGSA